MQNEPASKSRHRNLSSTYFFVLTFIHRKIDQLDIFFSGVGRKASPLFHDYYFLAYALIIFLIGWGFDIFNFPLSCDDIYVLLNPEANIRQGISQDRWGGPLITLLTGNLIVPVVPIFLSLLCYFFSFCVLFYSGKADKYFLLPVYFVFPVLFQSFSFLCLQPHTGICFLLSALSVYLMQKRSKYCFCAAVLFLAFILGTYSIFILYVAIAEAYYWLRHALKRKFFCSLKYIVYIAGKFLLLVILSYLLYRLILWAFQSHFNVETANYAAGFLKPINDFSLWFFRLREKIVAFYGGTAALLPRTVFFQGPAVVLCGLITVICIFFQKRTMLIRTLMAAAAGFIFAAPFLPDLFTQYCDIPSRVSTLCIPLALTAIFQLALFFCSAQKFFRLILFFLLTIISIQYLWFHNQCVYAQYLQERRDVELIGEIQSQINELPEFAVLSAGRADIPVMRIGRHPYEGGFRYRLQKYPDWTVENAGLSSIHAWGFLPALKIYGYSQYTEFHPFYASEEMLAFAEDMPAWPLKGSIVLRQGMLIIKFGDYDDNDIARRLNRKLQARSLFQRAVAAELTFTKTDNKQVLHSYSFDSLTKSENKSQDGSVMLDIEKTGLEIVLPAQRFSAPFVILEISADFAKEDIVRLWYDQEKQYMHFRFNAGENKLMVRCPSYFLNKPMVLNIGSGFANNVLLKSIKVYDDQQYTDRLLELNPALTKEKLSAALHD